MISDLAEKTVRTYPFIRNGFGWQVRSMTAEKNLYILNNILFDSTESHIDNVP